MQAYGTLVRRELSSYFVSLTGYVIIGSALFLIGYCFIDVLERLNAQSTDVPVTEQFFITLYFWYILVLAAPLITMGSFARETSTGTYETLMTAPVHELAVVLAKFTGAVVFHVLIWLPLMGCLLLVRRHISDVNGLGLGLVASTMLGILLIGALYVAMGCFASALTRSQIVAAMISFALGMGLFVLSYQASFASGQTSVLTGFAAHLSLIDHLQDFVRGVLDTRHLVFCLSLTLFFLYLTWKVLESRRWK